MVIELDAGIFSSSTLLLSGVPANMKVVVLVHLIMLSLSACGIGGTKLLLPFSYSCKKSNSALNRS